MWQCTSKCPTLSILESKIHLFFEIRDELFDFQFLINSDREITQLFLKIFSKYRKNFFKIACFKSFLTVPLNFLRISEHISIFSEYIQISSKLSNPFFLKLFPMLGKILSHIFTELCVPKFAWSSLLKILNTSSNYFPMQQPFLPLCCSFPCPIIPSATMIIQVRVSGEQGD